MRFFGPFPSPEPRRDRAALGAARRLAILVLAASLAACTGLLPRSRTEVGTLWRSFEEARAAIEAIEPGRTTVADLRAAGIDPYASPNVALLNYSDVVLRFPVATLPLDRLDAGLRKCLLAGKACTGYSISIREARQERVSGFFEDSLGFKRIVQVTGWSFNALILLVDGKVVYTLHGGQPSLLETQTSRQPLGPIQDWGDAVPGLLR